MDSLAKKNDRTRCFPDLLIEKEKQTIDAWFKENQKQNLENMNTFSQVYNLQVIAGLGI